MSTISDDTLRAILNRLGAAEEAAARLAADRMPDRVEEVLGSGQYQREAMGFLNPTFAEGDPMELLKKAAMCLPSEAGEFAGLVDKVVYQEYPLDLEMAKKMEKELGDVLWSIALACLALGRLRPRWASLLDDTLRDRLTHPTPFYLLMAGNIAKLRARYPLGRFTAEDCRARVDEGAQPEDRGAHS